MWRNATCWLGDPSGRFVCESLEMATFAEIECGRSSLMLIVQTCGLGRTRSTFSCRSCCAGQFETMVA